MKISNLTIFWSAYIIISTVFMRPALNYILKFLGKSGLAIALWVIFLIGGGFVSFCLYKSRPAIWRVFLFLGIFSAGLFYASQVKIVAERMHLINFGLLGWFCGGSMVLKERNSKNSQEDYSRYIYHISSFKKGVTGIIFSLFFCIFIATIEEFLQLWIPSRVGAIHDILLATLGSAWGISLFFLSHHHSNEL